MKKIKIIFNYILFIILSLFLVGCKTEDKYAELRKALDDTINYISTENDLSSITDDIKLVGTNDKFTYQFVSSHENVISNSGEVNRQLEIIDVTITIRVFQEELFIQDTIICTVIPIENEDVYIGIREALNNTINYLIKNYDLENITSDLKLQGKDSNYIYQFFSSNESVITNTGKVTRQQEDITILITVKVIYEEYSLQESIECVVKGNQIKDDYTYDVENTKSKLKISELNTVTENGEYNNYLDVIAYIYYYHKLPSNYLTKSQAKNLGWKGSGNVWVNSSLKGKNIGGDVFNNYEQVLPILSNKPYIEVDVNCSGGSRGKYRIVYNKYTFDIYYTDDHYETFTYMIGAN